jgi:hypothetical protein
MNAWGPHATWAAVSVPPMRSVRPPIPSRSISTAGVDHPEDDQRWDRRQRGETESERLDRNWNSLLQELRVV